ncbi:MAG: cytochrome C [Hyphomicrobiales bacterium]|nr:MAG: cytochrome C [Hyphomicrobiales bacterium]
MRRTPNIVFAALFFANTTSAFAEADDSALLERGRELATSLCGSCHAVGTDDASSVEGAPAFRDLGQSYPVDDLSEALAEGIVTGHEDMPEVALEPADIDALLGYIEHIQK